MGTTVVTGATRGTCSKFCSIPLDLGFNIIALGNLYRRVWKNLEINKNLLEVTLGISDLKPINE